MFGAAFRAEPQGFVADHFVLGEAVVQLADIDVPRADAGFFVDLVHGSVGHVGTNPVQQRRFFEVE
ncbi:hypothetical protein D3C81_2131660 [compost metagenome]